MKKIITPLLLLLLTVTSCTKQSNRPSTDTKPLYLGTYVSSIGDTTYVTENGNYAKLKLCGYQNIGFSLTFDSVIVATDNSFTDNEWVRNNGNEPCVGTGHFTSNTIEYNFTIGGIAHVSQTAIKL